ncbi:MAG: nitrate transporter [Hyphomicrobiales bacterium]|mgnify:CR=1 FL=1|nr:MAG: nitrate transporter [Hyphomicrobiales bacterium]
MHDGNTIVAGFIPLLDAAILIAAREKGFAAKEGIDLVLVRETSWANIRDRMAVGHFDAAHMLAPMPIAGNLGLNPLSSPTIAPMALGLGGNAVTVSNALWQAMESHGAPDTLEPLATGRALRSVVAARVEDDLPRLRFAVVHPHSGHNYELRYWLAASGIDPETDVEIVIIPPPLMADALCTESIDGYCVGEPWNTAGVFADCGRMATVKSAIWKSSPEKVLGVGTEFAEENPEQIAALLRALHNAAVWCGEPDNHEELAFAIADERYLDVAPKMVVPALSGSLKVGHGEQRRVDDFFIPYANAATFPWQSHALWFYSQMVRWGHVTHTAKNVEVARRSYRPDIYRAALAPLGVAIPGANAKVEGAFERPTPVGASGGSLILGPDGFFDGTVFDPDHLDDYLASQRPAKTVSK